MEIAQIDGATRVLGESQGYLALPIVDATVPTSDGSEVPVMMSVWKPTPDELAALNEGGRVILSVLGRSHPPVFLGVFKDGKLVE